MSKLAVEWRETAEADLISIAEYISDHNPEAAESLLQEIRSKAGKLADHPRLYQAGRVAGTREMLVRRNYTVIYAENENKVTILRVLHAAQSWPR